MFLVRIDGHRLINDVTGEIVKPKPGFSTVCQ